MTVDPSSRRYWCEGRHAKAVHEKAVFYGPGKKAVFLAHLPRYDCFFSIVSHKNSKDNKSLQICTWDYNMRRTKEVSRGHPTAVAACVLTSVSCSIAGAAWREEVLHLQY